MSKSVMTIRLDGEHLQLSTLTQEERHKLIEYLSMSMISYVHATCRDKIDEIIDDMYPQTIAKEGKYDVVFKVTVTGESMLEALGFARMLKEKSNG